MALCLIKQEQICPYLYFCVLSEQIHTWENYLPLVPLVVYCQTVVTLQINLDIYRVFHDFRT